MNLKQMTLCKCAFLVKGGSFLDLYPNKRFHPSLEDDDEDEEWSGGATRPIPNFPTNLAGLPGGRAPGRRPRRPRRTRLHRPRGPLRRDRALRPRRTRRTRRLLRGRERGKRRYLFSSSAFAGRPLPVRSGSRLLSVKKNKSSSGMKRSTKGRSNIRILKRVAQGEGIHSLNLLHRDHTYV